MESFALRHFPRVVFTRALRTFLSAGKTIDPELRSDMWDAFKQYQVRESIVRRNCGPILSAPGTFLDCQKLFITNFHLVRVALA
jgi:hypothetical protein